MPSRPTQVRYSSPSTAVSDVIDKEESSSAADDQSVNLYNHGEGPILGAGGLVCIVSYSRPSLMLIVSETQFHVYLPWGQRPFSIVS